MLPHTRWRREAERANVRANEAVAALSRGDIRIIELQADNTRLSNEVDRLKTLIRTQNEADAYWAARQIVKAVESGQVTPAGFISGLASAYARQQTSGPLFGIGGIGGLFGGRW